MDNIGILKADGRLQNSEFNCNKKRHPIIIRYGCKLMELIIEDAHKKTLHTLAQIRHDYWIISTKEAVKKYIIQASSNFFVITKLLFDEKKNLIKN